jgi:hypothetical protein
VLTSLGPSGSGNSDPIVYYLHLFEMCEHVFLFIYLFYAVLGLQLRASTLSHSTSPFF